MRALGRLCLVTLGVAASLAIGPAASAELHQDWSPPGGGGGLSCHECIDGGCGTAHPGHAGKTDCIAQRSCGPGCIIPCELSGASCAGTSAEVERLWVVPNGAPIEPVLEEPPRLVTGLATSCA